MSPRLLTIEDVKARADMGAERARELERWRKAAAVWLQFEPSRLRPFGDPPESETGRPFAPLLDDCVRVKATAARTGDARELWTLRQDVRVRALAQLFESEAVAYALELNAHERAWPGNALFADMLIGNPGEPESIEVALLSVYREAARIVERLSPGPARRPDIDRVERCFARETFLGPLRALTSGFVGRSAELKQLRAYVDTLESESNLESVQRFVNRHTEYRRPALVVHGVGGVGKSALVARFLLDHLPAIERRGHIDGLVFVYLDMERYELSEGRPEALVVAAIEQLNVLVPSDDLIRQLLERRLRSDPREFGRYLAALSGASPLLVVLDSFEVFQQNGNVIRRLTTFLTELQRTVPQLRVVVSGRAPAPDFVIDRALPREMALKELDESSAIERIRPAVADWTRAAEIVKRVGTSPLSLRLVLEVLRKEPDDMFDLRAPPFWRRVDDALVQGFLYSRILDRVVDDDLQVKRVVHPGMFMRRIDAGVLLHVLNAPCRLGLETMAQAEQLLAKLANQVALVTVEGDGAVRYRTDLRTAVVPVLLKAGKGDMARVEGEIHLRAIEHYRENPSNTPRRRAELVYHLLAMERLAEAEAVWSAQLDLAIGADTALLPEPARAWLDRHQRMRSSARTAGLVEALIEKRDYQAVAELHHRDVAALFDAPLLVVEALEVVDPSEARRSARRLIDRDAVWGDALVKLGVIANQNDPDAGFPQVHRATRAFVRALARALTSKELRLFLGDLKVEHLARWVEYEAPDVVFAWQRLVTKRPIPNEADVAGDRHETGL